MDPSRFLLSTLLILSLSLPFLETCQLVKAQEEGGEGEEEDPPKSCSFWIFNLLVGVNEALGPCLRKGWELNGPMELFMRGPCVVKCLLTGLGLLGGDGKLDQVAAAIFFGEAFPNDLRNEIIPKADPCFPLADKFKNDQYSCVSYVPFAICATRAIVPIFLPYALSCFGGPVQAVIIRALASVFAMKPKKEPQPEGAAPAGRRRNYIDWNKNVTDIEIKIKRDFENIMRKYNGSTSTNYAKNEQGKY